MVLRSGDAFLRVTKGGIDSGTLAPFRGTVAEIHLPVGNLKGGAKR